MSNNTKIELTYQDEHQRVYYISKKDILAVTLSVSLTETDDRGYPLVAMKVHDAIIENFRDMFTVKAVYRRAIDVAQHERAMRSAFPNLSG